MIKQDECIKFSVIIPVYNVELYLNNCLDSVLNQDIEKDQYEIILIDDGSTDGSAKICNKYKSQYKNIIFISQENRGVSAARNRGLMEAKGKYIVFIDSDDYIKVNVLSKLYDKMEKYELDVLAVNSAMHEKKGDLLSFHKAGRFKEKEIITGIDYINMYGYNASICVWSYIYRHSFLVQNNIKFVENLFHEDCVWTTYWFLNCRRIGYFNVDFYHRVLSSGSIMRRKNIKKCFDLVKVAELIYEHAEKYKMKESIVIYNALHKYVGFITWSALRSCVQQGYDIRVLMNKDEIRRCVLKYGKLNKKYWLLFLLIKLKAYRFSEFMIKIIIRMKPIEDIKE